MNSLASLRDRERERQLYDLLAAFARYQLETLGDAGSLEVLDAGVKILDVLADDDDVELTTGECRLHPGQLADGSDVAVRLEQRAKRNVGAAVTMADRGFERPLQHDVGALYRFDRVYGNSGNDTLGKSACACLAFLELDSDASCFYDLEGGINDLRTDTVARKYSYLSFCRCHQGKLIPLGSRFSRA